MSLVSTAMYNDVASQSVALRQLVVRPFDLNRPAAREVLALLFLCSLDMYSTVYWVATGQATEANPLLAWTFHLHPLLFVLIKAATFLPTLVLAAHMAQRHPHVVTFLLRGVLFAYIAIYIVGVLHGQL